MGAIGVARFWQPCETGLVGATGRSLMVQRSTSVMATAIAEGTGATVSVDRIIRNLQGLSFLKTLSVARCEPR